MKSILKNPSAQFIFSHPNLAHLLALCAVVDKFDTAMEAVERQAAIGLTVSGVKAALEGVLCTG